MIPLSVYSTPAVLENATPASAPKDSRIATASTMESLPVHGDPEFSKKVYRNATTEERADVKFLPVNAATVVEVAATKWP
jgi:hypothetical protein